MDKIYLDHPLYTDRKMIGAIHADLAAIKTLQETQSERLGKVAEILEAWDNTKGFVKTVKLIAAVAKWFVVVGGTATALYYWFKR